LAPFVVSARSCLVCAGVLGSLCDCGRSRLWFYRLRFRSRPRRIRIRGSLQLTALRTCSPYGVAPISNHRTTTPTQTSGSSSAHRVASISGGWSTCDAGGRTLPASCRIIDPPPHIDGGTIAVGETVVGFMYGYDEVDTLEFMADCAFAMLHERRALMLLRGGAGVRALP